MGRVASLTSVARYLPRILTAAICCSVIAVADNLRVLCYSLMPQLLNSIPMLSLTVTSYQKLWSRDHANLQIVLIGLYRTAQKRTRAILNFIQGIDFPQYFAI